MAKQVKFKLNGVEREAPEGQLVIEAAKDAGVEIPHYCYHPALGNPGNCRLCVVEVAGAPKPMVSCRLPVREGLDVKSDSEAAKRAQQSSLELHLVNHPLDCPVCDQSGECGLQDYYMKIGGYQSEVREDKEHKDKRIEAGPHVMLDQERCILCTRCTRFVDNVTKTHELGIFRRGHAERIELTPGMTLDNAYSGNVVDICPVGALTDRDFRYKVRVWYLDRTESVCPGCARGCSISVHTSTQRPWHNDGKRVARIA
jgi:NADH-quinone oxidoreductase subunit G